MPALAQAQAVQQRAAHAGFDWDDVSGVLDKLAEEVGELAESESVSTSGRRSSGTCCSRR